MHTYVYSQAHWHLNATNFAIKKSVCISNALTQPIQHTRAYYTLLFTFPRIDIFSFFGVASLFELLCAKCRRHRIHHHINGSNHIRINRLLQLQQCVGWSHVYVGLLYSRSLSGGCTLEHGNYAIGTFTSQNFSGRFADLVSGTDRGTSPEATGKCSRILGL